MSTDIDALHAVVNGKVHGRSSGKTYAKCHELAGLIELGFKDIFCIMSLYDDINYLFPMVYEVLEEHEIETKRIDRFKFHFNESDVRFITSDDRRDKQRGFYNFAEVRMTHWS